MSIPIKSQKDLSLMQDAAFIAARVLEEVSQIAVDGATTHDLDHRARRLILDFGAKSACYRYKVNGLEYPSYICVSVNDEVVHGVPSPLKFIRYGDCVSIDVVIRYRGFVADNAKTIVVGPKNSDLMRLTEGTRDALFAGIAQAVPGNRVGDISHAIQESLNSRNLGIIREYVGHGVGVAMHEEPQIPNVGQPGTGPLLKEGMTLAIEPLATLGSPEVFVREDDGWTVATKDRKMAAHFEHTVLISENGPKILTSLGK